MLVKDSTLENGSFKILVVDDESDFRLALLDLFRLEGFSAEGIGSATEFESFDTHYDKLSLIVLDRQLPDGEGLDLLKQIRATSNCPVVILTGAGTTQDKVCGYDADADQYLVKPVNSEELLAVVRKLIRSRQPLLIDKVEWRLDEIAWVLIDPLGNAINLTKNELKFLGCFVEKFGVTVERASIIVSLGYNPELYDLRRLEVLVRRLRKKLENFGASEFVIATVYGVGYALNTRLKRAS